MVKSTLDLYHRKSKAVTEFKEFAHRGHSLVLDSGWREIAEYSLDWLQSQQLGERNLSAEASDNRFLSPSPRWMSLTLQDLSKFHHSRSTS
jgi:hypothetical protein